MKTAERMKEKGWSDDEVHQLMNILYHKKLHLLSPQTMARIVYWAAMLLSIAGNFIVAVALVPVFWVLPDWALFFVLVLVGISFGALFNILIKDIELIDPKHRILGGLFLPSVGVIFMYIMVNLSNKVSSKIAIPLFVEHSAWIVSIVYILAFMAPYFYTLRKEYVMRPLQ